MNLSERLELIRRNTVELVTEEDIRKVLETKKKPITYCGYETSGEVHLGHMVTVTKLMDLEKAGFHVKILLADWHAMLNRKGSKEEISAMAKLDQKQFAKLGLEDPEFVLGSDFQQTPEYVEDVLKLSIATTLNRAMRSMQEVARDFENAHVCQMIYPLMQIADIKHLKVDVAQAGIEQRKIHMLGRETMHAINYPVFGCVHTPLVNSLLGPGKKMSSSIPDSMISVRDSEEAIKKKLVKAYCPEGTVEDNPVMEIAKYVLFPRLGKLRVERPAKFGGNAEFASMQELEAAFAEKKLHPLDLKNAVAFETARVLAPVRKAFEK
ncbi:MAG: tyrosine--tRNA ligase [Candidatus Diapherotrites archaeon]|uniref:Tyrosine--tRNA ligase n=1 Tax=Candidatus Iainarchaeum sp. TaxID=3101447 RepID=A0A8T4L9R2_9ARCH|nr:tyrosine--tRNA ligase [Candidatus Diapherotrites archaeon]